jgi:hypothetical protein
VYSDEIENLNKSIYETLKAKKIITCVSVNILEKKIITCVSVNILEKKKGRTRI